MLTDFCPEIVVHSSVRIEGVLIGGLSLYCLEIRDWKRDPLHIQHIKLIKFRFPWATCSHCLLTIGTGWSLVGVKSLIALAEPFILIYWFLWQFAQWAEIGK